MREPKPFKIKRRPLYAVFRAVLMRTFYRKPSVTFLSEVSKPCIFVCNHDAKRGPVTCELYLPIKTAKWGAYQMLCDYNTRRKYLRDIFYMKKQGMGRKLASFKAFFEAFFSLFIYRGMNFLPTYPDARLSKTIKESVQVLENGMPVLVFPEDSDGGYKEKMEHFFPGFVMLAEAYYRRTGKDIPVYPIYCDARRRQLVVGEPRYAHALKEEGLDRDAIAQVLCGDVNKLFENYINK